MMAWTGRIIALCAISLVVCLVIWLSSDHTERGLERRAAAAAKLDAAWEKTKSRVGQKVDQFLGLESSGEREVQDGKE